MGGLYRIKPRVRISGWAVTEPRGDMPYGIFPTPEPNKYNLLGRICLSPDYQDARLRPQLRVL